MEVDVGAAHRCSLVARFVHRHAHSSKRYSILKAPACAVPFRRFTFEPCNALVCLSASVQEEAPQTVAGIKKVKVKFILRRKCEFGQRFFVIGDHKLLGEWKPEAAIPMEWSEGHVWTSQLDIVSGIHTEFKVLLKANEELLEWQPGPNCKLEASGSSTSQVIFVPWSRPEESPEKAAPQSLEINDLQITQDAPEQPIIEEGTSGNKTAVPNFEVFVDVRQEGATELSDQELIGDDMHWNSEPSQEFLSLFPIPESWYAEQPSNMQANQKVTDPPPGLSEVATAERTLTSASEIPAIKKDEADEKMILPNEFSSLCAEAEKLEADAEDVVEKDNHKGNHNEDEQTETNIPQNMGVGLPHPELRDVFGDNGSSKEGSTQRRLPGVLAEPKNVPIGEYPSPNKEMAAVDEQSSRDTDTIESSTDTSNERAVASPSINELSGSELPGTQSDTTETVETECREDKRPRRKGWSKLWGAFVQGRFQ